MGPFASHRFLTRVALSGAHTLAWLFIFQYFYVFSGSLVRSLTGVALTYALTQTIGVLCTPLFARRLRRGVRGMLVNALLYVASAFAILAAGFSGVLGSIGAGVLFFSIAMGLYRALYWIPYEIASHARARGGMTEIVVSLVPALAGWYVSTSPQAPVVALALASVLSLLAIVPLYFIRNTQEGFSWRYRETFHNLFKRSHRVPLIQAVLNGFEGAALLLLWPIAMLVLLGWSYASLGVVLSITFLATMLVRHFIGGTTRTFRSPVLLSVLTVSGWFLRGTVAAPFSMVLVDTYFQSGSGVTTRGIDLLTAEQSADSNSYVDEFTALKEMGQGLGRIGFCLLVAILSFIPSFAILVLTLFTCAALFAVVSIALSSKAARRAF